MLTDPRKNQGSGMFGKEISAGPADVIIGGEETLTIADMEIKVLETPGHTKGGVCFIIGDTIFTGDTLFAGSIGRTDFPGGSMIEMISSLRKLKEIQGDYIVYPGHGEGSSLFHEKVNNYYMHYDLS